MTYRRFPHRRENQVDSWEIFQYFNTLIKRTLNFKSSFTPRFRSNHRRCSVKKGVLKNFLKFTGKHLPHCLFFNKFAHPRPANLFKKKLQHRCFPLNFAKFLRLSYFYGTPSCGCFYRFTTLPQSIDTRWGQTKNMLCYETYCKPF